MSHPDSPTEAKRSLWTGISIALFVIGLLILVPSGLCTGIVLVGGLRGVSPSSDLSLILIIGGVPMAIGAALAFAGFTKLGWTDVTLTLLGIVLLLGLLEVLVLITGRLPSGSLIDERFAEWMLIATGLTLCVVLVGAYLKSRRRGRPTKEP